jgi:hypothetical protein
MAARGGLTNSATLPGRFLCQVVEFHLDSCQASRENRRLFERFPELD